MIFRSFLVLLALVTFSMPAYADENPIGTVVEIEGTAMRTPNTGDINLKIDDPVYLNDVIDTGPASKILILLVDDTEITLGESSTLTLDKYVYDEDAPPSGEFSVVKGSFLLVSGLISKVAAPDVKVNTSYGTIGLRGTTVWGGELDGEYGVLVQDGAVDVTNQGGSTRVTAGLGTFMKNRLERPRLPKAWAAAKTERAVKTIALARHEQVRQKIATRKVENTKLREIRREKIKQRLEQKQGGEKRGDLRNDGIPPEQRGDVIERLTGKKPVGALNRPRKKYNR